MDLSLQQRNAHHIAASLTASRPHSERLGAAHQAIGSWLGAIERCVAGGSDGRAVGAAREPFTGGFADIEANRDRRALIAGVRARKLIILPRL